MAPLPIDPAVISGIADIYELFAEGKISLETACLQVARFLDSKGELNSNLNALKITKNWKR